MSRWMRTRNWTTASKKERISSAIRRFKAQSLDTPENRLMFAVFEQALRDLDFPHIKRPDAKKYKNPEDFNKALATHPSRVKSRVHLIKGAIRYLQGDILHAELAGLDCDWVHDTLKDMNLLPSHTEFSKWDR